MPVKKRITYNSDGSVTKRTTVSRKTLFGGTKSKTYVEKNNSTNRKGHSILLHLLLCCVVIGFFTIPYYTFSSRHYWHL